jgi:hypothetical protein
VHPLTRRVSRPFGAPPLSADAVDRPTSVGNDGRVADAALYFPYIEVPDSPALARVLLYWDELGSIIPRRLGPTELTRRTRELVDTGLVRPLDPGGYWRELEGFTEEFLALVEGIDGPAVAPVWVHRDKGTGRIRDELIGRELARTAHERHWVRVDGRVAAIFMASLAGRLSRVWSDARRRPTRCAPVPPRADPPT